VSIRSGKVAEKETDDLSEMYDLILNSEVVEGPLVSGRWSPNCGPSFCTK
jgi:hypothetical protein